jgi:hypothetical protein
MAQILFALLLKYLKDLVASLASLTEFQETHYI